MQQHDRDATPRAAASRDAAPTDARSPDALSPEEMSAEQATDLPDREAMSVFGQLPHSLENFAMPINTAEAANYYSTSSVAAADADQIVILDQDIDATPDEPEAR